MSLISITGLTKTYTVGDVAVQALRGVDLEIEAGDFLAVVGPSGSGKSTFMHILGCLDCPSGGRYLLEGRDVSRLSRDDLARVRNSKIGFVFQSFNLLPRMSASERRERAMAALAAVGLDNRAAHHPNQLSGGQQQRVAIARALMTQPPILLADEPTGNLDTRTSLEVMEIFQRLQEEPGMTVILITHEHQIAEYGSRIVSFRDGRIVSDQRNMGWRGARSELAQLPAISA
jgi:putative ABC transport system ATP-binding protein